MWRSKQDISSSDITLARMMKDANFASTLGIDVDQAVVKVNDKFIVSLISRRVLQLSWGPGTSLLVTLRRQSYTCAHLYGSGT